MKALAVIPARGGSKGIPRKNLCMVAGRPLLAWSIAAAHEAGLEPVVSSEDPEILNVARSFGARPLLRPPELATDEALTDPVLVHAIQQEDPQPDVVVLLQPTVPVRAPGLVRACLERLQATGADSLLTAYPLHFVWWQEAPEYSYGRRASGPLPPIWRSQCPRRPRRQDMVARELMYHEDGSVFVCRTKLLLETGQRLGGGLEVYETARTVDVDTEQDLLVADALLRAQMAREAIVA